MTVVESPMQTCTFSMKNCGQISITDFLKKYLPADNDFRTAKEQWRRESEKVAKCNLENSLTVFRPGGKIVPALTLDVYNSCHKQARPTRLGGFS